MPLLEPSLVQEYQTNGVVVLRGLLSSEWVDRLRTAADEVIANPSPLYEEQAHGRGLFHDDQLLWLHHPTFKQVCLDSPLGHAARDLMTTSNNGHLAPGINLFFDELFIKEPNTDVDTPWHNDMSYWQLVPDKHVFQSLSMWCALDHVPKAVCPKYKLGSHEWQISHSISNFGGRDSKYAANTQTDVLPANLSVDQPDVVSFELAPGDVVVHDAWTVHMAPGNPSATDRRRAYVVRYATHEAQHDNRPGTMHQWWQRSGFDAKLDTGAPLGQSELFPMLFGPAKVSETGGGGSKEVGVEKEL